MALPGSSREILGWRINKHVGHYFFKKLWLTIVLTFDALT
jgi:hypothetical protein